MKKNPAKIFDQWPDGCRLADPPHEMYFILNETMTKGEMAQERECKKPTYLRHRSVIIDTLTGQEVNIDLSCSGMFGRFIKLEVLDARYFPSK